MSEKPNAYRPRQAVSIAFTTQGRTKQSFKAECDVNNIMAKYLKTGAVQHFNDQQPQYYDCPSHDFREALEIVADAEAMFAAIPAHIRRAFDNDPATFLEFCQDPANAEKIKEMGLSGEPPNAAPVTKPEPKPGSEKPKNTDEPSE